jgi:hypothetical protein
MEPLPLVLGLAVSAAVMGAIVLAGRFGRAARLVSPSSWRAIGLAAAYLAGHLYVHGWPGLPPAESAGWPFWLALPALAAALAASAEAAPVWLRLGLVILASASAPLAMLRSRIANAWSPGESALAVAAIGAALAAWCLLLIGVERRGATKLLFTQAALSVLAAFAAILLSGSVVLGRLAGAVAAALGAAALLAPLASGDPRRSGSLAAVPIVLGSILIAAVVYAELPAWSAGCLALSTLAGAAMRFAPLSGLAGWRRAAAWLLAAALPAGVVVGAAALRSLAMQEAW